MNKVVATLIAGLALAAAVAAQEATPEDGLFGDVVVEVPDSERDQSKALLTSETVEIGGTFRFKAESSWTYEGLQPGGALADDAFAIDMGAKLFLDARPEETFRVFGKTNLSYPFTDEGGTRSFDDVFHVVELFSDFQLDEAVFFRAGKQTIHWGVGYFFSPADLLNITEIDPEDPEAELEGPVALKAQVPVGPHNLYLYVVMQDVDSPEDLAIAPKGELVVGDAEIGVGAYYRRGDAPAAMATVTTSWGDFDLFAEGVLSYGSNRTFVVESPPGVAARTYDDVLYPSATGGLRYRYSDDRSWLALTVAAQYLWNAEGYDDADLLADNWAGVSALLAAGKLAKRDLVYTGRHYAALSVAWTEMFTSDFTLSATWLANLGDRSGMIAPQIRWQAGDNLKLSLKVSLMYGETGADYTRVGESTTLSLEADLGSGSF